MTRSKAQVAAPLIAPDLAPARGGEPYVLPYHGVTPDLATAPERCGADAAVLGRVTLGRNLRLGTSSVIRADGNFVTAGDDFSLGDRSTIHIEHDLLPAIIGDRVTIGTNAVVHACTVGNDVVVGDGALVLDGAVVPDKVVLEPNSVVFPAREIGERQALCRHPGAAGARSPARRDRGARRRAARRRSAPCRARRARSPTA